MTRIALEAASIGSGPDAEVPAITGRADAGAVTFFAVETAERPLLVSLLLAGRIRPDRGRVLLDGRDDTEAVRRTTALVDTPVVAEAPAGVSLVSAVAEELAFAGRASSGKRASAELRERGLGHLARVPMRAVPVADRIELLLSLAAGRPGIRVLILTSPERHGGSPAHWFDAAAALADDGFAVIVVTDVATASVLDSLGARDASAPLDIESDNP